MKRADRHRTQPVNQTKTVEELAMTIKVAPEPEWMVQPHRTFMWISGSNTEDVKDFMLRSKMCREVFIQKGYYSGWADYNGEDGIMMYVLNVSREVLEALYVWTHPCGFTIETQTVAMTIKPRAVVLFGLLPPVGYMSARNEYANWKVIRDIETTFRVKTAEELGLGIKIKQEHAHEVNDATIAALADEASKHDGSSDTQSLDGEEDMKIMDRVRKACETQVTDDEWVDEEETKSAYVTPPQKKKKKVSFKQ